MSTSTARVLEEIAQERTRQDDKFGDQSHKTLAQWSAILHEEVGEADREVCELLHEDEWGNQGGGIARRKRLREELIQTAAVAVAFITHGDANGWW